MRGNMLSPWNWARVVRTPIMSVLRFMTSWALGFRGWAANECTLWGRETHGRHSSQMRYFDVFHDMYLLVF